jgi:hypothetical protein
MFDMRLSEVSYFVFERYAEYLSFKGNFCSSASVANTLLDILNARHAEAADSKTLKNDARNISFNID